MSIDIATVARYSRNHVVSGSLVDSVMEAEELLTGDPAVALFRRSPESAMHADGLYSAETLPYNRALPVLALATESPSRFLALISHLTPILQDIFIQYYLVGRTYSQIGLTLFPGKSSNAQCILVKTGNRLGLRALAALIRCGTPASILKRGPGSPFRMAWEDALAWQSRSCSTVRLRSPRDLGDFIIVPNGQLSELFAPSWSVIGPSALGGS